MMSLPPDADTLVPRHPEDETLLAYLDGELEADASVRTAGHLEQCWACRGRTNGLEASIHAFLEEREYLLPPDLSSDGPAEAGFRQRLAAHTAGAAPRLGLRAGLSMGYARVRAAVGRLAGAPVPWPRVRVAAVPLTLVVATIAAAAWWGFPVSAEQVMAKAEVRDFFDTRCNDLVVRAVVHVDRIDGMTSAATRLADVETQTDPASFALGISIRTAAGGLEHAVVWGRDTLEDRQPLAGLLPGALADFLAARRWAPGVSVPGYLRLLADRGAIGASARKADGLFELVHPFAAGHPSGIVETRLYVDAHTWLPTQVSLFTDDAGGRHEFRIRRATLEYLPRTDRYARLFASARPELGGSAPAARNAAAARPWPGIPRKPLPLSWAAAPATDEEVAVAAVLHDLRADLGEEINVFPMSDGSLLVQGLVDSVERRSTIEQALQQLPSTLRIEIYVPPELSSGSELFDPPWRETTGDVPSEPPASVPAVRLTESAGRRMALQDALDAYVARSLRHAGRDASPVAVSQGVAALATTIVTQSREALFHAWAIHRLDSQFSEDRGRLLSAAARRHLAEVRGAHRTRIGAIARDLRASIAPLGAVPSRETARAASAGVPETELFTIVIEADALIRQLFTLATDSVDPAVSLPRLDALLNRLG